MTMDIHASGVVAKAADTGLRTSTLVAIPLIAIGVVGVYLVAQEPRIQDAIRAIDGGKIVATLIRDVAELILRQDGSPAIAS